MQLWAKEDNRLISIHTAVKQKDYSCPECLNIVRLRFGIHRQAHFYHLETHSNCRQHQKSLQHLQTQLYLNKILKHSFIEKAFPEIDRIADVFWEKENTVFEIQYSAISLEEVQNRCHDYKKLGLKIFWILHEETFNQKKMSSAESYLRAKHAYFTNIDEKGNGIIYDQLEISEKGTRTFKGPPLEVALTCIKTMAKPLLKKNQLPEMILSRLMQWPIYFEKDLLDRFFRNEISIHLPSQVQLKAHHKKSLALFVLRKTQIFYKFLIYSVLEKI